MRRYAHSPFLLTVIITITILLPLSFSQLPESQKNIMIRVSQYLNISLSTWNTSDPDPCKWPGVTCTQNSISHLSLSSFKLQDSNFLPLLCNITSLQSLNLSNNLFSSIPTDFVTNCTGLSQLKSLNLSMNSLFSPLHTFVGFSSLEVLDLSQNRFSGNISSELGGLVSLQSLNLSGNEFRGPLPTHLGMDMALKELQLSKNNFFGEIPEELVRYGNLTLLDLSVNFLSGSIPSQIGNLFKLEVLVLSSNALKGGIPHGLVTIKTLRRFAANQNYLEGSIPVGITTYVRNLDLSYNELSDTIPPNLLSPPNLEAVDLTGNKLEGSIPVNLSQNLFRLRLGTNSFHGSIPPSIGKLSKLMSFEVDNNGLTGEIPLELENCEKLTLLNLAVNHLNGTLPKGLGNLLQLVVLKLHRNQFSGEIPAEITQLKNLSTINLGENLLEGMIPPGIAGLLKLSILDLGDNNLNGSIPDSLEELKQLLELQLGNNRLAGNIPSMPLNLQIALNLSHNRFEGPIPGNLSGLNNLEVLDLSNNRFTGEIPSFLFALPSLTELVISNNNLSGTIPMHRKGLNVTYGGNNLADAPTNAPVLLSGKKKNLATLVVIMVVVGAVAAIAIVIVVFIFTRGFYQVDDENEDLEDHIPQVINGHLITTDSIHRSSIDFPKAVEAAGNPANIMFKSRFSTYYRVIMPCGMSYCIKKLNWSDKIFQLGSHDRFGQELEALGRLNNSRIMMPLAYVLTSDSAYLFYEHEHKGTLFEFLHKNLGDNLDWLCRYNIALGIAQGLAFLHGCGDPVLLLDLSTKTIVLKSLNEPQIADIELCKVIDPSKSTGSLSTVAGSVGYIPPEYAYTMILTMPGNVYSFGVVLLELLTGKLAVSEGTELAKWVLNNSVRNDAWEQVLDASISKTSLAVRSQMLSVLKIAKACVSVSPEARPKMKNVVRMLLNAR